MIYDFKQYTRLRLRVSKYAKYYSYKENGRIKLYHYNIEIEKYQRVEEFDSQMNLYNVIRQKYKDNQINISILFEIEATLLSDGILPLLNQNIVECMNNNIL